MCVCVQWQSWCPTCAGLRGAVRKRLTTSDMRYTARQFGGEFISSEYKGAGVKVNSNFPKIRPCLIEERKKFFFFFSLFLFRKCCFGSSRAKQLCLMDVIYCSEYSPYKLSSEQIAT